jgi:hypothetical protein
MISHILSKLKEFEQRKKSLKPKIDEVNIEREREIQNVNKKYDHIIADLNYELRKIENNIYNDMIKSFVDIVTREFEVKRSNELYTVTEEFKEYRANISKLKIFPEELIEKLDNIINGKPIEEVIYILDDIKAKYLKS